MKILYLMHVDWNWIKQRPHFIAEYLNKNNVEIDVYYQHSFDRKGLSRNSKEKFIIRKIPRLPFSRFSIISKINKRIYDLFLFWKMRVKNYDYVYLTHPSLYSEKINIPIIYDCMDDIISFPIPEKQKKEYLKLENQLLRKADFVIFTAHYLSEIVKKRCGCIIKKYSVINNAIELPISDIIPVFADIDKKDSIICTYIGTISDWFDFDLLEKVQEKYINKKIIYNLYGPVEIHNRTINKDIFNLKGSIPHEKIFEVMNNSDVLIMPFIVTDLIKSVNPVKLYEYIYSGKPVISVKYGETEKFEEAVYLYEDGNVLSLCNVFDEIYKNKLRGKISVKTAHEFVKDNTWESRVNNILKAIYFNDSIGSKFY